MSFLLDTDICSAYLKGDRRVWQRFMQYALVHNLALVTHNVSDFVQIPSLNVADWLAP